VLQSFQNCLLFDKLKILFIFNRLSTSKAHLQTYETAMKTQTKARTRARARARKLRDLKWSTTPSKSMPHGLWGVVSLFTGSYLTFCSIVGNLKPFSRSSPQWIFLLYLISTFFTSMAGYRMSDKAQVIARPVFKQSALLQICLVYFMLRFSTYFSEETSFWSKRYEIIALAIRLVDTFFAVSIFLCTLSFQRTAFGQWEKSKPIAIMISVGCLGLTLLAVYPAQLALFGQNWWDCIQDKYQEQNAVIVTFTLLPTTMLFSLILFGVTLNTRGILSDIEFSAAAVMSVLLTIVLFALVIEYHIPDVSTLRMYLPCHEPEIGSTEADLMNAFDVTHSSRTLLKAFFDVNFQND
jgi:hypothetical protein